MDKNMPKILWCSLPLEMWMRSSTRSSRVRWTGIWLNFIPCKGRVYLLGFLTMSCSWEPTEIDRLES